MSMRMCLVVGALMVAGDAVAPAMAQAPRPVVKAAVTKPAPGEPEFRDPKTGQIWTPENVGQDGKPLKPGDQAFDPLAQAVVVGGVVQQQATSKFIAKIPVTVGPTVPMVDIDNPTLRVVPGARWRVAIYLNNNTASMMSPIIDCTFTNDGRKVEETWVLIQPTAGGTRVALTFYGPRSEIFVDMVSCRVAEP
jgi:hypothetical protein